jgi:RecB family endonuclease NucS
VEEQYGDLDDHFESGTLEDVVKQLGYSLNDAKLGKPHGTKLNIEGNPYNVLNNFKTGIRSYKRFREEGGEFVLSTEAALEEAVEAIKDKKEGKQFELERHLQESLRQEIAQLEPGLVVVDGGSEHSVASGDIDILAKDLEGVLVVIELKRGLAKREAIGQIAGYMGDLLAEEGNQQVRGIIVAADFDKSCRSAILAVRNLQLRRYRYAFQFEIVT